ncbi:hypothetical protein [Vibrio quintilis]|uniref:Tir chaperone protein (CesT) n=1 Tax=Vibrio quintilis TaxID=1117707 RepID=A0A1M7YSP7_9VIBR|nr:hypothetical protein [Vibrio quintilis]SHO55642.1 hypothetical protein VQ7734_01388 [Vibrio quintilis]
MKFAETGPCSTAGHKITTQNTTAHSLPAEQLQSGLTRWFHSQQASFSFGVDHYRCELSRQEKGVFCQIDTGLTTSEISPVFLLQITQAGMAQFSGLPAVSPENQYSLGRYQPLSGTAEEKSLKVMALIEDLLNQADVWCDMTTDCPSGSEWPSASGPTFHPGLTLSQQLRTFQD